MFWKLEETRLVQVTAASSAVAGLTCSTAAVPLGKIWVILAAGYMPDVAETRIISFYKVAQFGGIPGTYCISNPISLALNPARATFIEQGMEYYLLPGEYITARRDAATAGSVMNLLIQFVEIDQPLYTYDEPQIVKRQQRALSSLKSRVAAGGGLGSRELPSIPSRDSGSRPPAV